MNSVTLTNHLIWDELAKILDPIILDPININNLAARHLESWNLHSCSMRLIFRYEGIQSFLVGCPLGQLFGTRVSTVCLGFYAILPVFFAFTTSARAI